MSFGGILSSIIQFLIVGGIAFAILCLVTSYMRFQQMALRAAKTSPTDAGGDEAFRMQIAARLGSAHREPEPFQLILIRLVQAPDLPHDSDPDRLNEAIEFVTDCIYQGIRGQDSLLRLDERTLGSLIGGSVHVGREVVTRIAGQLTGPSCRFSTGEESRVPVNIGIASFPQDGDRVEPLLSVAFDAIPGDEASRGDVQISAARETGDNDVVRPVPTPENPLAALPESQHVLVDPLTGVLLEDHLGSVLQKQVAQCRKDGKPASVMTLQIDHLERYLDHYGPGGVETIFRHLGCFLQGAVREVDLLGRLEEDKFVVLLFCSPKNGMIAAQRIAEGIRRLDIDSAGTSLKITASIGVAGYPDHGSVPRKLLEFSMIALEVAKAKGRNLCLLYESGMEVPQSASRDVTSF